MLNNFRLLAVIFILISSCTSCGDDKPITVDPVPIVKVPIPKFEEDSAYNYISKQVNFGPRVPNTTEHTACKNWIVSKMKSLGAKVIEQDFKAKGTDGKILKGTNIIAQYNLDNPRRVLLCAHWDSRYVSDHDPDEANHNKPVLGANDGGSGVGILMEIARNLQKTPINMGVDIVFFDLEDQGDNQSEMSWCLGSQHWAANLHRDNYKPKYGILLDMAGSKDARFTMEAVSMQVAPTLVNKIWKLGKGMGFGKYFSTEKNQRCYRRSSFY